MNLGDRLQHSRDEHKDTKFVVINPGEKYVEFNRRSGKLSLWICSCFRENNDYEGWCMLV